MEDAGSGGHPLRVALTDDTAPTVAVVVCDFPVEDVGDCLDAAVGCQRSTFGLVSSVDGRTYLVQEQERVSRRQWEFTGEWSPDPEARSALNLLMRTDGGENGPMSSLSRSSTLAARIPEVPAANDAARVGRGTGIDGMRGRATALGGALEAAPRPEGGFRVQARLPLEARG